MNRPDRGSISVMVAITALSLVLVVGLVLDCGGQLRAMERADALAQEAARAVGQQLDIDRLRAGGGYQVDQDLAQLTVQAYLAGKGATGHVGWPKAPDLSEISVTVDITFTPALLSAVGVNNLTVHGYGKAALVHGITEGKTG